VSTVVGHRKHARRFEESATPNPDPLGQRLGVGYRHYHSMVLGVRNPRVSTSDELGVHGTCHFLFGIPPSTALFLSPQGSRIRPGRLVIPAGIRSGFARHHLSGTSGWLNWTRYWETCRRHYALFFGRHYASPPGDNRSISNRNAYIRSLITCCAIFSSASPSTSQSLHQSSP
jgi:hypothetical protein